MELVSAFHTYTTLPSATANRLALPQSRVFMSGYEDEGKIFVKYTLIQHTFKLLYKNDCNLQKSSTVSGTSSIRSAVVGTVLNLFIFY